MYGDDDPPQAITNNYDETLASALEAQVKMAKPLFEAESDENYGRPAYARMEQDIIRESLLGGKTYKEGSNDATGYDADGYQFNERVVQEKIDQSWSNGNMITNPASKRTEYRNALTKAMEDGAISQEEGAQNLVKALIDREFNNIAGEPWHRYGTVEQKTEREYVLDDSGEKVKNEGKAGTFERTNTGSVGLIAGDQKYQMSDGTFRRTGYDVNDKFMGTSAVEQDLLERAKSQQVGTELGLAEQYGAGLTDAYRGNKMGFATQADVDAGRASAVGEEIVTQKGDIQKSLDAVTKLRDESSSIPDQITDGNRSLFDLANQFTNNKVTSPYQQTGAPQIGAVGNFTDPNAVGVGTVLQSQDMQQANQNQRRAGEQQPPLSTNPVTGDLTQSRGISAMEAGGTATEGNVNTRGTIETVDFDENKVGRVSQGTGAIRDASTRRQVRDVSNSTLGDMGGLRSALSASGLQALNDGGDLSARELRNIQQDARSASTARGRSRDMSAIMSEVQNSAGARRQRLNENRQFAQNALGQEGAFRQGEESMNTQIGMANQQRDMGMMNADLQAQLANQQKDITQRNLNLQESSSNVDRDLSIQNMNLQAGTANQGADMGLMQSNLQADLANQQNLTNFRNREFQANSVNQGRQMDLLGMDMTAQQANLSSDMARNTMIANALDKDYTRQLATRQLNEQMQQSGLAQQRQFATQNVGLQQATSADALLAITGRSSGAGTGTGQNLYGNGQLGLQAQPQLYNMAQGAQFQLDQNAMLNNFNMNNYASNQAKQAGMFGAVAGMAGSLGSAGITAMCWVAREVYGVNNPQWLQFREYVINDAPSWFRKLYLKYGEKFAKYISDKPRLKSVIKKWMDSKIKGGK